MEWDIGWICTYRCIKNRVFCAGRDQLMCIIEEEVFMRGRNSDMITADNDDCSRNWTKSIASVKAWMLDGSIFGGEFRMYTNE